MDYTRYHLQADNCDTWSSEKRRLRGCGTSCGCPRLTSNWDYLDTCQNYVNLIRGNFLTLDDIGDIDWHVMNRLLQEETHQKEILDAHAKKVKELLS